MTDMESGTSEVPQDDISPSRAIEAVILLGYARDKVAEHVLAAPAPLGSESAGKE